MEDNNFLNEIDFSKLSKKDLVELANGVRDSYNKYENELKIIQSNKSISFEKIQERVKFKLFEFQGSIYTDLVYRSKKV